MAGGLLPQPKQLIQDNAWNPGIDYQLYTYEPASLTPKVTYQDNALSIANTNPVLANARGEVVMYGAGSYRIILKDSLGNTIWDRDNIDALIGGTSLVGPNGASLVGYDDTTLDNMFKSRLGRVVGSVAELRSLKKATNTQALATGYYAMGDGGGGTYYCDVSDTTSADNGGSVIVASDGARWKLANTSAVSVKQFGAKGDGATDDAAAINRALSSGAKTVYFPAGVYVIGAALVPFSTQHLYGDGWESIIYQKNGANLESMIEGGINTNPSFRYQISDLKLDGNKANQTAGAGYGIRTHNPLYCWFTRVIIESTRGSGFFHNTFTVTNAATFENYLMNCRAFKTGGAGAFINGPGTDNHIRGGNYGACDTAGIYMSTPSSSIKGATIFGAGITPQGVSIDGASIQVQENEIEGFVQDTVVVSANGSYAYIAGNKIYAGCFTAGSAGLYDGITVAADANYGTITNNKVYAAIGSTYAMRYAISFAGAHNQWTISGNDLTLIGAGATQKTGMIVNGLLSSDKTDSNWSRSAVVASLAADITAPTLSAWTKLVFGSESSDPLAEYTSGVFQPYEAGTYEFDISMLANAAASGNQIGLALYKNGVEARRFGFDKVNAAGFAQRNGTVKEYSLPTDTWEARYFVEGATTSIVQGGSFSYLRIRRVAQ